MAFRNPMGNAGTSVVVEPSKAPNAPGGVKWHVRVDGFVSTSHNYKNTAVEKARSKARAENATLTVLNKNMNVSEQRSYS